MSRFQTTRWSLIDAARGEPVRARPALEQLCRMYHPPVLAYIRQHGHRASDAEDLVQEFFVHFLERGWHAQADPQRGRFRSLLLTTLRHFLIDQYAQGNAQKRGSGRVASIGDAMEDIVDTGESPEQAFTRAWLATIMSNAMTRLRAEWEHAGKIGQFVQLAPMLIEHGDSAALQALADATGTRCNTLAVQAHRMRQRLRQLVRLELLQTVGSREALEDELTELRGTIDGANR